MRHTLIASASAALLITALTPASSLAHHGVNGQFDRSKTLEKTGTITRVRLVNPHAYVYFDVTNDAGDTENWRCELRSGSLLKRKGWSADLFEKGEQITISGSPAHDEPTTCYSDVITFSDGRQLTRYGEVSDDGSFNNPEEEGPTTASTTATKTAASDTEDNAASDIPNLAGNWSEPLVGGPPRAYGVERRPEYKLTEKAIEDGKQYTAKDNPRFQCQATNIIMDYRFDQMINKIEQTPEEVTIWYGFMDVVRHIHIDGEFPAEIEPSLEGYSVGTWKDGKLEVLTKGFKAGFLEAPRGGDDRRGPPPEGRAKPEAAPEGTSQSDEAARPRPPRGGGTVLHSDQMEIAETFYIDDKGELVHEYTITDPVYLAEPHSHLQKSVKTDDAFIPFECDDLTIEEGYSNS